MTAWNHSHLSILAKMLRAKITGSHHKQRDTIKDWSNLDGDVFESAMDELVADTEAPVVQTARDTVKLTSIQDAKDFIEEHDDEGEFTWYL